MKRFLLALPLAAAIFAGATSASAQDLASLDQLLAKPNGEKTSVAQLGAGKVTVVSFWATWCKPCKEEMRAVFPLIQKFQGKVEYIAISIDDTKTMSKVGPYVSSKGYTFAVLLDPSKDLFRSLNGTDVPYTLIYKADGTLHSKHDGYLAGDEVKLEEVLIGLVKDGEVSNPTGAMPSENVDSASK